MREFLSGLWLKALTKSVPKVRRLFSRLFVLTSFSTDQVLSIANTKAAMYTVGSNPLTALCPTFLLSWTPSLQEEAASLMRKFVVK